MAHTYFKQMMEFLISNQFRNMISKQSAIYTNSNCFIDIKTLYRSTSLDNNLAPITKNQGPDVQKELLRKVLSLAYVFHKFILSYKVNIFIDFYM